MKFSRLIRVKVLMSVTFSLLLNLVKSHKPITAKLKFRISGRNLIDTDGFTTTDGYVVVWYTNDGGKTSKLLGRTETISNKKNPDWSEVFEFHFDRKLKQYFFFHVYDDDSWRFDDSVGRVWVKVEDYVDKNELANSNLDKGGYITIKGVKSEYQYSSEEDDDDSLERSARQRKKPKVEAGILPFKRGTPKSKKIRFKVTARGIMRNRYNNEILVVTQAEGVNGAEKIIGKSTAVTAGFNPVWDKVFTLNWNKVKDQRLHFRIYDSQGAKKLRDGDLVGDAWIEANDYIAKGEEFTVLLPDKGSLTMAKTKR